MQYNTVNDELWQKINKAHSALDNYLIVDEAVQDPDAEKTCAIYFSGNGIFFPKSNENFEDVIMRRNRFEWFGTRINRASRHIFLRDLKMCWYQEGISTRLNTIDKLADFLREQTAGFKTVCVGSSAGGYAALLFSALLHSERCFPFSPCVDVARCICLHRGHIGGSEYWHRRYDPYVLPGRKYNNLLDLLPHTDCIRYVFSPMQSVIDIPEYSTLREVPGCRFLRLNSPMHGIGLPRETVENLINLDESSLNGIYDVACSWDPLQVIWRCSKHPGLGAALRIASEDLKDRPHPYLRKRFYANLVSMLSGSHRD